MKPVSNADRRGSKRFQVDLPGTVLVDGRTYPVRISDLSASGALVCPQIRVAAVRSPNIVLSVKDFGAMAAKIVRSTEGAWGVAFDDPRQHRFRLIGWLQQEAIFLKEV